MILTFSASHHSSIPNHFTHTHSIYSAQHTTKAISQHHALVEKTLSSKRQLQKNVIHQYVKPYEMLETPMVGLLLEGGGGENRRLCLME